MHTMWRLKAFAELTVDELYAILTLRQEVFIVEQNCVYLDTDGKDKKSHHLFSLNEKGQCTACLRLVSPGVSYSEVSIGRVASSGSLRGSGHGRELMREGMRAVELLYGKVPVRISAQSYLQRFYESFGFVQVSEPYMEDDIPHIQMLYTP